MNDPLVFLLAVHNHQPVGNFVSVFERAFEDCYRPFLRELRKHPDIKFAAHYSGPLLEYMRDKEGECWEGLKEMVARGQVELLGGGFYEPILSVIPEEDRLGQLGLMSRFLEANFETRPRGIWLTERVWEPSLPRTLAQAGIEYTLLDEEHFHYAGVRDIHSYYITEDQGYPLKLFPIDKKLRYLIPFHAAADIETYLREIEAKNGLAILGDDGEKFGLWPGTKAWVYGEGWLVRFLDFLKEKNIRTCTYAEILETRPPAGRVYLPPASYEEMMEWVLEPRAAAVFKELKTANPPAARRYLRGGFFREFFLKYPESNLLNKRMILVSRQVNRTSDEEAKRELYKGQCNDATWHGVFGGIYFPHLREAAYEHLLKAERMIPAESGWRNLDYDQDGRDEMLFRNSTFGLIVKPAFGGSLVEIDHYPSFRNLSDVLSRRQESYHTPQRPGAEQGKSIHELVRELPPGSERLFRYDRSPRFCALDHFFPPDQGAGQCSWEGRQGRRDFPAGPLEGNPIEGFPSKSDPPDLSAEKFENGDYEEWGDFADRPYAPETQGTILRMGREGRVGIGPESLLVRVQKEIEVEDRDLILRYRIKNLGDRPARLCFASEWNFYQRPEEIALDPGRIRLCGGRLRFEIFPRQDLWSFPLRTLSQSEKGYDIIHQGFCLLPSWNFTLGGKEEFVIRILLGDLDAASPS